MHRNPTLVQQGVIFRQQLQKRKPGETETVLSEGVKLLQTQDCEVIGMCITAIPLL